VQKFLVTFAHGAARVRDDALIDAGGTAVLVCKVSAPRTFLPCFSPLSDPYFYVF